MATSLIRLPLGAPTLQATPLLNSWMSRAFNLTSTAAAERDDSAAPLSVSPTPQGRLPDSSMLVRRRCHALTWLTFRGCAHPLQRWCPASNTRSFASQEPPQPQHEQGQQAAGAQAAGEGHQDGKEEAPTPGALPPRPPHDVVYVGPLSQQHKLLKRISIANTLVASAAAPAIVALADNISLVSRYGLAASLVFFGLITTGALHWVAHPYVHELQYNAATGQIDVRTTTLLGNSRWHSFNVDEVRPLPWNRPVATFMARDQFYYIDVFSFPDEALLRRLTPDEADVPKGYKDKEEDDDD